MDYKGKYLNVDGDTGILDLDESINDLTENNMDSVINSVVPGKPQIIVFLSPHSGDYKGFHYSAIAVSYSNEDMEKYLALTSFEGTASSFMIHPDGRVILNCTTDKEYEVYNFLAMLRKYSDLDEMQINRFQEDLIVGKPGNFTVNIDGTDFYLIYECTSFMDWTLVGLIPTQVVNQSMNTLQKTSLMLAIGIMLCLTLMIVSFIARQNRKNLQKKDTQILYRDELFSTLSVNVDDVFLMLNAEDMRVDYLSPNIEKLVGISEKKARENIHALDCLVQGENSVRVIDILPDIKPGEQTELDREYVHQKTNEVRWFHVVALCRDVKGERNISL